MAVLTGTREGDTLVVTHYFPRARYLCAVVRLLIGWMFLWVFFDKALALGFPTGRTDTGRVLHVDGWFYGGSPTTGFLQENAAGPFAGVFQALEGSAVLDFLFMAVLLSVGTALVLGVAMQPAAVLGATLLGFICLVHPPWVQPSVNPFVDMHIILGVTLVALAAGRAGDTWGLGWMWKSTRLVLRYPFLA